MGGWSRILCAAAWLSGCGDDAQSATAGGAGDPPATSGTTDDGWVDLCEPAEPRGAWVQQTSLPQVMTGATLLANAAGQPLLIGGADCSAENGLGGQQVLVFDGEQDRWLSLPDLPHPLQWPMVTVFSDDGLLVVGRGAEDGPPLRRGPQGEWVVAVDPAITAEPLAVMGRSDDDVLFAADRNGTEWVRSSDRGDSWSLMDGPGIRSAQEVPPRLLPLGEAGLLVSGWRLLSRYDADNDVWTDVRPQRSGGGLSSAVAAFDMQRVFALGARHGPPGDHQVYAANGWLFSVPENEGFEELGFACRSPIQQSTEEWWGQTFGAGAGRVFVAVNTQMWIYDASGWANLPDLPGALRPLQQRLLAMPDGTLLAVGRSECSTDVWRWVPEP